MSETLPRIRVLVVDDHPIVRQGVRSLLASHSDVQVVGEAGSPSEALEAARALHPDVVLLDMRLPGATGTDLTRQMSHELPSVRIIVLTSYDDDEYLVGALEAGAFGYLLKSVSDETLIWAIRAAYRGERQLSPALLDRVLGQFASVRRSQLRSEVGLDDEDIQVLRLVAAGASNESIAATLNWSRTTVKRKVQHIFDRLEVATRAQAAAEAVRRGLI